MQSGGSHWVSIQENWPAPPSGHWGRAVLRLCCSNSVPSLRLPTLDTLAMPDFHFSPKVCPIQSLESQQGPAVVGDVLKQNLALSRFTSVNPLGIVHVSHVLAFAAQAPSQDPGGTRSSP